MNISRARRLGETASSGFDSLADSARTAALLTQCDSARRKSSELTYTESKPAPPQKGRHSDYIAAAGSAVSRTDNSEDPLKFTGLLDYINTMARTEPISPQLPAPKRSPVKFAFPKPRHEKYHRRPYNSSASEEQSRLTQSPSYEKAKRYLACRQHG